MVTFYPVWSTPVGSLTPAIESQSYGFQLDAAQTALFSGANGTSIILTEPSPLVANTVWSNSSLANTGWFTTSEVDYRLVANTNLLFDVYQPNIGNAQIGAMIVSVTGAPDLANSQVGPVLLTDAIPPATVLGVIDIIPVANVTVNSQEVSGTVTYNALILDNAVVETDVIQITTATQVTYTLLHDNLPPGLTLNQFGYISGTIGTLQSSDGSSLTYDFAVRAKAGDFVRDRQFSITASPTTVSINPPSWGPMPPFAYSAEYNGVTFSITHVPLGHKTRGTPYSYQINIEKPGGLPPTLILESIINEDPDIVAPFNSLPPGLTLDLHTGLISGAITTDAPLGMYFFRVVMHDNHDNPITTGTGQTPRVFMIEASPPQDILAPVRFIKWTTDAGSLGKIYENQTSPVGVFATCTTGETCSYVLINSVLPVGLSLNSATGDIEGIASHVTNDRTYSFTVRAQVGETFEDRVFSITVVARYKASAITNVAFKLRAKTALPMISYYPSVINDAEFFRPTDPSFGLVGADNTLTIYIVGGLAADSSMLEQVIRNSQIGGPVALRLGEHKLAYAKVGGKTVYEVLYREVIDPFENAGGYRLVNGVPVSESIVWPESNPADLTYLHPTSINNIRYEFIDKLGFPALTPDQVHKPNSISENLPTWMPTFVPAVPIAYLKPGTGQGVLDRISVRQTPVAGPASDQNPLNDGHRVEFDQYYTLFQTVSTPTTFWDDRYVSGNTVIVGNRYPQVFDGDQTRFDLYSYQDGKYYRINPKTAGSSS